MPLTTVNPALLDTQAQYTGFKNRIINGAMVIDQRNAGAAVTVTIGAYSVDRWLPQENNGSTVTAQQSTTAPSGFTNSLLLTASTGATSASGQVTRLQQRIEGFNWSDLGYGAAGAKTVTVSFWVRSSVTGTYCFGLVNGGENRSYASEYSISVADTWEYKTITIAGDTSGTWLTTNGIGIFCFWDLGSGSDFNQSAGSWSGTNDWKTSNQVDWVGTTGATFYITGVQLEKGSTATSFDYRPYGTELALCQRYYYRIGELASQDTFGIAFAESATGGVSIGQFPETLRTSPSALEQNGTASDYVIRTGGNSRTCSAVPTFDSGTNENIWHIQTTVASGQTAGQAGFLRAAAVTTAYLAWSAEL